MVERFEANLRLEFDTKIANAWGFAQDWDPREPMRPSDLRFCYPDRVEGPVLAESLPAFTPQQPRIAAPQRP